jgi:hypothetical protein
MALLLRAPGLVLARDGNCFPFGEVTQVIAKIAEDNSATLFFDLGHFLSLLMFSNRNPVRPTVRTGRHVNDALPGDEGVHVGFVGCNHPAFELFPGRLVSVRQSDLPLLEKASAVRPRKRTLSDSW